MEERFRRLAMTRHTVIGDDAPILKRSLLAKLGLLLGSTLAALLAAEGILRVARPQLFDRHPPGMYSLDPQVGYVLTPGFAGTLTRPEFSVRVKTGRSGLRGADPRPRRPNSVRVLLLGDSQVWGYGVADDETLAWQLENLLAERYPELDVQVLNGGVPGYGTADELNFLRSRGSALCPDLVILFFLPVNDFQENRLPAIDWVDATSIRDGMLVWTTDDRIGRHSVPARAQQWLKKKSHLARLLSDTLGYFALRGGLLRIVSGFWVTGEDFTEDDAQLTGSLLRQVAATATNLGAQTLFVFTTGQDRVLSADYTPPRSATVVQRASEAGGASWIDVTPALRQSAERSRLFYRRDGHWTATGHRVVAEIVAREVDRTLSSGTTASSARQGPECRQ